MIGRKKEILEVVALQGDNLVAGRAARPLKCFACMMSGSPQLAEGDSISGLIAPSEVNPLTATSKVLQVMSQTICE